MIIEYYSVEIFILVSTTPTTTPTTTSPLANAVLVLNTHKTANKPMVIDWDGKFLINFIIEIHLIY